MKSKKRSKASQKRADNQAALVRFSFRRLQRQLPLSFPVDLPAEQASSPKRRYRSRYRYQGWAKPRRRQTCSSFILATQLFDFSQLEPLLATHLYRPSAKGQVPFHPVSMYLLILYRRTEGLSRPETLRRLQDPQEGQILRQVLGFEDDIPSESGLRYVESRISPELQQEINALQIDALFQAGLLPTRPKAQQRVSLAFDGMLHQARSRMRCAHVQATCYRPAPRPCPAREKGKQGCSCQEQACKQRCRYAPKRDPEARLVVYTGNKQRNRPNPNASQKKKSGKKRASRMVYGYYSYCGQVLDDELATYWALPAAFGPATTGDRTLFPQNFAYLGERFPWLQPDAVLADAGAGYQNCLNLIWEAGALRLVDIVSSASDDDPQVQVLRGYDDKGHPLCPFGFPMRSNGHDYQRRQTKWRCAKACLLRPADERPDCAYLKGSGKHGYSTIVGRTHADGSVRLAREVAYGSDRWKQLYHRRNCAESRNSVLERLGLKRLPVHGLAACHVTILQADFIANQRTLIRLMREANALPLTD
jgi:hypothetical protein